MFTLKAFFITFGLLYIILVILHKLYFSKLKDNVKISNYVAIIAFMLAFYILSGLALTCLIKGIFHKLIILFFSLSPFIVGRFATYKKEKLYTILQFILIVLSIAFIILY